MNLSDQNTETGHQNTNKGAGPAWAYFVLTGLALLIAISHESFWIDESGTGVLAMQSSLHSWWNALVEAKTTELQSPFYSIYMWAFAKIFGGSEWTLRAAGLVWLVPGIGFFVTGLPRGDQRLATFLAAATSPFIWYYAGEARPYAMYMAGSFLAVGAICRLCQEGLPAGKQSLWLTGFLGAIVLLCGANMIGVIWAGCASLAAIIAIPMPRLLQLWKIGAARIVVTLLFLAGLGGYYFWTLRIGARGTSIGGTTAQSAGFVFYEQLGLLGLGPSRTELREGGMRLLRPYAPVLLTATILTGMVLIKGFLQIAKGKPAARIAAAAVAVGAPVVFLFGAGLAMHWRVLGRHFAGLMPVWIALLAFGLTGFWRRPGFFGKFVAAAYLAIALWSCLLLRFASRHARDDYRDAAQIARQALEQNQSVWWNAAEYGARYYKVALGTDGAVLLVNPASSTLTRLARPNVIITSKPDVFDSAGSIVEYLTRNRYRSTEHFPAFTIWREN